MPPLKFELTLCQIGENRGHCNTRTARRIFSIDLDTEETERADIKSPVYHPKVGKGENPSDRPVFQTRTSRLAWKERYCLSRAMLKEEKFLTGVMGPPGPLGVQGLGGQPGEKGRRGWDLSFSKLCSAEMTLGVRCSAVEKKVVLQAARAKRTNRGERGYRADGDLFSHLVLWLYHSCARVLEVTLDRAGCRANKG